MQSGKWQFWIDRGGTFTDLIACAPDGALSARKMLSENPERYKDAAVAGIKSFLGIPFDQPIPSGSIEAVKMGTTVATNALLERDGENTLLMVNTGFADLLRIGNQARPRLFDLNVVLPDILYEKVVEISGRVDIQGNEIEPLDEAHARAAFSEARAEGMTCCAIALIHAWRHPGQELRLAELAKEAGFTQISVSHAVSPLPGLVPRASTTVVDAYLSPVLRRYVDQVQAELPGVDLYFMQSHGGLVDSRQFQGKDAILSGPAGGIVGAARTAEAAGFSSIIGFDMGGTSTDVALYDGAFERSFDAELAGASLRVPMMAINTVAAGGGSILHFDGARFRVGPDSAGADPGPACYRRGGPLTVTDANLFLGRVRPEHFPAIFGPHGDQPLDVEAAIRGFEALADKVAEATGRRRDPHEIADGFLRIATANMANAIKQVSLQKGRDPARFTLACFGGAGAQHACQVADALGMGAVFIHPFAGVLSAYGMGLADQTAIREQAVERPLDEALATALDGIAARLAGEAKAALAEQGARNAAIEIHAVAYLRYQASEASLPVRLGKLGDMESEFTEAYRDRFGFADPGRQITVASVSVEAVAPGQPAHDMALCFGAQEAAPLAGVTMWSGGEACETAVWDRAALKPGARVAGPALIREANTTIIVETGWNAEITPQNCVVMRRAQPQRRHAAEDLAHADPVLLELFNNLFMTVAEHAGVVLRNTAQSVNIKERLDYSCAIFDAEGRLVANAPHVPVHLGAMGESVRSVLKTRKDKLKPGDVIALNDPFNGGSHLPDITVVTPVFDESGRTILFFLGNRGHHADIGGITPGSTPPDSQSLEEEGVIIDNFLLVDGGRFREREFRALLASGRYPARNPGQNVADIAAQVAANEAGARELKRAIADYGWATVQAYMGHVMDNAEEHVRRVIDRMGDGRFTYRMDDGALLNVAVSVDHERRSARIDFTGTSAQKNDNFNAPPGVTRSVALYVFRCLVGEDIPLNEGCLAPLDIVIPAGSFLSPRPGSAVVAGNTEISQAVCNALFGALGAVACSQGTMNNFLFGDHERQYYETICGGIGAGRGFAGADAVQSHMTNTRMTDPEVLELNYPVRLEEFSIRRGSGGAGAWRGGDGAVRRLRFLTPLTAVMVASRRSVQPFGLAGGSPGASGHQWIEGTDGAILPLAGRVRVELAAGEVFGIATPGGGGYGRG